MAKDQGTVIIRDRSIFKENHSLGTNDGDAGLPNAGGAGCTHDFSRTYVSGHTVFQENNSTGPGRCHRFLLLLVHIHVYACTYLSIVFGIAGGALAMFGHAHLEMTQVTLIANSVARGAGAIAAFENSTTVLTDCLFDQNMAENGGGGAVVVDAESKFTLSGCVIRDNRVRTSIGGGLWCGGYSYILITNRTVFLNNTGALGVIQNCNVVITGSSSLINNTIRLGDGGAGISLWDGGNVTVNEHSIIQGNSALDGPGGGGILMVGSSRVTLDAAYILGNIGSIGGGVHVSGSSTLIVKGGTVFKENIAAVGQDLHVGPRGNLSVQSSNLDPYGSTVVWQRTQCIPGEVYDQGVCRKCLPSTYSLVPGPDAECHVCPEHAVCATGGAAIIPQAGYWHSNPYSTQIHRCPHVDEVCLLNATCAAGYGGNLCGVCEPGYGTSAAFSCGRCMGKGVQWALYIAAGLLAVLLVAFTVHSTWQDNHQLASQQQSVRSSDMIKVLILFLQYLVIVSSLSVPWPTALAYFFRITKFVFAASNGQLGSVSVDCVLLQSTSNSSIPVSVQRQLIYLVAPLGVLAGVILLSVIKAIAVRALQTTKLRAAKSRASNVGRGTSTSNIRRGSSTSSAGSANTGAHLQRNTIGSTILRKLPLMCVVTFFVAYPFLVRVSLGLFACLQLDKAEDVNDPYPQFAVALAGRGYWIHAMQQACFEGWHLPWALGLGLPCVLLFCVATPLALLVGLTVNKSKLQRAGVRAQFGFLYRPYIEKRSWWEGLMTVQTVLLVTVLVFRYTLGGFYSALLVTVMFTVMATLQLIFKPFASQRLHIMQLVATGCLYVTSGIAQSLFSVDIGSAYIYREVIGAVAVCINVAFVAWCCYCILAESKGSLGKVFGVLKRVFAGCCPSLCRKAGSSSMQGGVAVKAAAESVPSGPDADNDSDKGNNGSQRASLTQMADLPSV